ncbi:MAG TPA: ribosome maturation factor RimP [Coriobacteriia bacterium]
MAEKDKEYAPRVIALLEAQAAAHGFELVTAEFGGQSNAPLVRVYLDRESGLDIDAIAAANAWVKEVLDAEPKLAANYTLEVSSPGIERPLVKLADFDRFAGWDAKITTTGPVEGRKHFTGRLLGVEGTDVLIEVDGTKYRVPHGAVRTARLRVEIDFNKEGS